MARTMSASGSYGSMTHGQIRELTDRFRVALEAHRGEIRSGVAQDMLAKSDIGMTMFATVRKMANELDRVCRVISVPVAAGWAFDQGAQAVGFRFWTNSPDTVEILSGTQARWATLVYFESSAETAEGLAAEYRSRNLAADPWAQLADYGVDPEWRARTYCLWLRPDGVLTRFKFFYPDVHKGGQEGHVEVTPWSPVFNVRGVYAGVPMRARAK